jgi:hypothetical protein
MGFDVLMGRGKRDGWTHNARLGVYGSRECVDCDDVG